MPAKIEIINSALTLIGEQPLLDLSEDNPAAVSVQVRYDMVRDALLRRHRWSFSMKQDILQRLAAAPSFDFQHKFQLPEDPYCLRVLHVGNNAVSRGGKTVLRPPGDGHITPYAIFGRELYADLEPLQITYVARITDTNQYDSLFVAALYTRLAMELAYDITGSNTNLSVAADLHDKYMREARAIDGKEKGVYYPSPSSVTTRWQGGSGSGPYLGL